MVVYGSCSVVNKRRDGKEEVVICPQRLYADDYASLKRCASDALAKELPFLMASQYSKMKSQRNLPAEYVVVLGQKSGKEVSVSSPGVIGLSFDWVMALIAGGKLQLIVPCEVQSIDITGNYRANWRAYSEESIRVRDSKHGMNWANVWKRLIPQLILKGSISSTSRLCKTGQYFIVPDRVYVQFEKLVGPVAATAGPGEGVLTVMTYSLGEEVPQAQHRSLVLRRTERMLITDFAKSFGSGSQLPSGDQLDAKVLEILAEL